MESWLAISVFSAVGLVATLAAVAVHNRLVLLNGHCDNAFAQIEVQLKRRYDLVPNLVEQLRLQYPSRYALLVGNRMQRNMQRG